MAHVASGTKIESQSYVRLTFGGFVFPFLEGHQRGVHQDRMTAYNVCVFYLSVWPDNYFNFYRTNQIHPLGHFRVSRCGFRQSLTCFLG
jgi:hypothetical protein